MTQFISSRWMRWKVSMAPYTDFTVSLMRPQPPSSLLDNGDSACNIYQNITTASTCDMAKQWHMKFQTWMRTLRIKLYLQLQGTCLQACSVSTMFPYLSRSSHVPHPYCFKIQTSKITYSLHKKYYMSVNNTKHITTIIVT